uniref:Lipid A ethanolaminephosphotransferase n=1 Tax=Candidatus Kentrum sp. DK TaxID=2126562 RepID=A0A450T896_9GAMM|nr:MAG: lipid A ethanolaminephosphotransferase [Candidatus Kentron sp. DK]
MIGCLALVRAQRIKPIRRNAAPSGVRWVSCKGASKDAFIGLIGPLNFRYLRHRKMMFTRTPDKKRRITATALILCVALFLVLFDNLTFFRRVLDVYPLSHENLGFLLSIPVLLAALIVFLLTLVGTRHTLKPLLIVLLPVSSLVAYFMDTYHVVMDKEMIRNVLRTDPGEGLDLLSIRLVLYVLLLGVLPAFWVYRTRIERLPGKRGALGKARDLGLSLLVIAGLVLIFSASYTVFFREHKPLRYYTNPTYYLYSLGAFLWERTDTVGGILRPVGEDARVSAADTDRELIILVVGEAARADRFSLNGYGRDTNPLLEKEDVIFLPHMHSCGTTTAYSLPCLFSHFPRQGFTGARGADTENLLDVLGHSDHVHVLWRDNNSDSKGVALRVPNEDFKSPKINPVCDVECRDVGMLAGLQEVVDAQKKEDILIILHQMGNHGPAYYKRYPTAFARFTPTCDTNRLDECTPEEIGNTYDNAILYTDFFLSRVIAFLKQNSRKFETAMVYMSDHGESLGEHGLYLHGLPYAIAPQVQKHVAALLWFGDSFHEDIDRQLVLANAGKPLSHDNLFHTILGLLEVETSVYDQTLDITHAKIADTPH